MSNYNISPALNKDRVFILQKSEIEKRLDPFYYSPLNKLIIIDKTNLPKKKLSEVAELKRGKFSHRPRNDERFYGGKYPFIQTGDIVKASNNLGKIEYTQTLNELGLSVSKLFDKEVLLITIAANIGDTSILDYPACFPDSVVAITSKNTDVSLKFLNVYFKFLKKYLENLAPQAAQKNLTLEQLAPTPVVIPTITNQNKIVNIFDNYIEQKKQNEAEAEKILASIDDYLLKELGITLPVLPENKLKNRIFASSLSELSGTRFDPYYYTAFFNDLHISISKGKYPINELRSISLNIDTGKTPPKSAYLESDMQDILPIIKAGSYSGDFIDIEKSDFVKSDFSGNTISQGDIFILGSAHQAEYVGKKVYYLNEAPKQKTFFVGELVRISANPDKCESSFLFSLLKTKLYMDLLNREKRGQTSHLYPNDVKHIFIPVPPLDKQKEIADHISGIMQQAQQLQEKTKEELSKVSQEIEKILLA